MVDNCQVEHQGIVVETSGVLQDGRVFVLFDSGASDSFISPFVVVRCGLVAAKQDNRWQVELASGAKVAVESFVRGCRLRIGSLDTTVDL